jgi:nitroreductase
MNVKETITQRRAYRSFVPAKIDEALIRDLADAASLAPSCFNNQPWRYVFVYDKTKLEEVFKAMNKGNEWTFKDSMIIAVLGKKDMDCAMKDGRFYYHYDIGCATGFLILRAWELGLVAHPIAGYNPELIKQALKVPADMEVITLVNVGKHADTPSQVLSEKQLIDEKTRPARLKFEQFAFINEYKA